MKEEKKLGWFFFCFRINQRRRFIFHVSILEMKSVCGSSIYVCVFLHSSITVRPSVHLPSDTQQPEEKEDGNKQEEGVLPVVVAVVEVAVALVFACILVWGEGGDQI